MEVVRLLEEEGRIGRLWLIDSSPEFLQTLTKLTFMTPNAEEMENELQIKIILRFMDLIWPEVSSEVNFQSSNFILKLLFLKNIIIPSIIFIKNFRSPINFINCQTGIHV